MPEYRDMGALNSTNAPSIPVSTNRRTQVYQATHVGDDRLPYMYRSFISFTYGGIPIEDFGLIATQDNFLDKELYASFEDTTTTYDNLDGQFYWSSHFKNNQLDFTLSTDEMTQQQLDRFKRYFIPGEAKELVLAEHPNRAIFARVLSVPHMSLMPFEGTVLNRIGGQDYSTKTTLYRGSITLSFVMDQPHWFAITNVLGIKDGNRYLDQWYDVKGNLVSIYNSPDALKIALEDGIPIGSAINDNMLLGNGAFASVEITNASKIWSKNETDEDFASGVGAKIEGEYIPVTGPTQGYIAGAIIDASGNGISSLTKYDTAYFYYCGTAPAPTIISFTMTPHCTNLRYINTPANRFSLLTINGVDYAYNRIEIGSSNIQELCLTTPNIYTSYNKAISIMIEKITVNSQYTWDDIRVALHENVRHSYIRDWAGHIINWLQNKYNTVTATAGYDEAKECMELVLCEKTTNTSADLNTLIYPAAFSFNSETGETKGTFTIRKISGQLPSTKDEWYNYGEYVTLVEDVGDMLRSNSIILQDKNQPDENGNFVKWTYAHPEYSHYIKHNFEVELQNFSILYKNMYL